MNIQYHARLNTLNDQVKYLDDSSLADLAAWLYRKYNMCEERRKEAEEELRKNGNDIAKLRVEWAKQVATQTKPIPSAYLTNI